MEKVIATLARSGPGKSRRLVTSGISYHTYARNSLAAHAHLRYYSENVVLLNRPSGTRRLICCNCISINISSSSRE